MIIALHKNARTTPAIRAEIAASADSVATLAARYHVSEGTIRRWKSRSVFTDASHTAHRLQTTLTPAQEAVVVELRKTLLLPLDDLLAVCREFICASVSRSGLDRCLRRHGVGNLRALLPATPKGPAKGFKAYEPGYVHVDVKYLPRMADESARSYLPSYSPELNPDEMLNANLKAAITAKAPARRKGQLKQVAIGHLRHLQKSPAKVKQFFQKDTVKYAA